MYFSRFVYKNVKYVCVCVCVKENDELDCYLNYIELT